MSEGLPRIHARLRARSNARLQAAVIIVATLVGALHLVWATRGTFFYLDDWDFAIGRADLNRSSLFGPQNQNWHSLNVLVFRGLSETFGLENYAGARAVAILTLLGIAGMTARYTWVRLSPWAGALAVLPLFFTAGWETVLWPFQMAQLFSIAAGMAAILLLDGQRRGRLPGSAGLLVVAVASSSAGVPMLGLVLVDRLLRTGRRREALVALPSLIAYYWWDKNYGYLSPNPNPSDANQILVGLRQSVDTGSAAIESFLGFGGVWGAIAGFLLLVGLVVLICWRIFGGYPVDRARVGALLAGLVGYWVLLSYGRSNVTAYFFSPRYLFISMVLLVLLFVELARSGVLQHRSQPIGAVRRRWMWTRALPAVVALGILNASWQNAQTLRAGGYTLRHSADAMHGQIAALSLLPPEKRASAPFYLDPVARQLQRSATLYFEGLARFGGSIETESDVLRLPERQRVQADRALFGLATGEIPNGTRPPVPAGTAPPVLSHVRGGTERDPDSPSACVSVRGQLRTAVASLPTGVRMSVTNTDRAPATLTAARYGPEDAGTSYAIAPAATRVVDVQPDLGTQPWRITLRGRSARVCAIAGL